MSNYDYIRDNIADVRKRVESAAKVSGRMLKDIDIIAVTKTVDTERIMYAVEEGLVNLGENRVQELVEKYDIINRECNWHLIGHLQTNKVKYIIDKVKMIHSLDRIELADEIQARAEKIGKVIDVLVQVNVSGEKSKFGIGTQDVMDFIKKLSTYSNLRVRGLMTMAPYVEQPEDIRYVFRGLREIFIDINNQNVDNICMDCLSMGMSNDFEVAIEEGANMVRIGTAIFGRRGI